MRILVVDDDYSVANGIVTHLPWEKLRIDEAVQANSAEEAREAFRKGSFEIVLCDIEMPGENGISLVEWIRTDYPATLCIFLTAHADFSYAQKGVRLGCFDYILQPTTYDNIEEVLRRAVNQVSLDRHRDEMQELAEHVRKNEMTMVRHILREYLYGGEGDGAAQLQQLRDFGYRLEELTDYSLLRIQLFVSQEESIPDRDTRAFIFENVLEEQLSLPKGSILSASLSRAENLLLIPDLALVSIRHQERMEEFRNTVSALLGADLAIYVLSETDSGIENLRAANARIAEEVSDNVRELPKVLWIEQLEKRDEQMLGETWGRGRLIRNSMRFNFARWQQLFLSEYYDIVETETSTYLTDVLDRDIRLNVLVEFHELFVQMILVIMYKEDINVSDFFTEIGMPYHEFTDAYHSTNQLREACLFVLKNLRNYLDKDHSDGDEIKRARSYILEHIRDDISVQQVAEHVHFTPEYLTKSFKKVYGRNVKEYILDEKFSIAKDRLKNTRLSVSTIGADIGYTNLSHFITLFKKREGVTPSEYRKNLSGE